MNIGIRLHDTLPGTLAQRLACAKAQGFSCAHLALSKALSDFSMDDAPRLLTEELAARVREDFAAQGMECAVLGCYLNLADPDEEFRRHTQEIYRAHLHFCRMIGARVVGTETYANPNSRFAEPAGQSEEAFQLFIASLRPVVRWAEEEGAALAIEPVWSHIISSPERAERMLDAMKSDSLQIILDSVNLLSAATAPRAEEIVDDALRRLGDRVRILHMKDYIIRPGEANVAAVACGLGEMRYGTLVAFARAHDIPMTLENTTPDNAEAARKYLEEFA